MRNRFAAPRRIPERMSGSKRATIDYNTFLSRSKEDALFTLLGELPLIPSNLGKLHLALYLSQVIDVLVAAVVGLVAEFIS